MIIPGTPMTSAEHIDLLERPDPASDAAADGQDSVYREVEAFPWRYAQKTGLSAKVLLPSFLIKPRVMCEEVLSDYRRVLATVPDLPGAHEIDKYGEAGRTVDPSIDYDGEPMVPWEQEKPQQAHVPILVHRSGKTVVRHIIRGGYTFDDAMRRIDGHSYEDYRHAWSDGSMLGRDVDARLQRLVDEHIPTQCDFGTHHGTDRQLFSWPIDCGQFLVVLRCCMSCWTEFLIRNDINAGNCRVIDPADGIG
jgi:hypothetical protein